MGTANRVLPVNRGELSRNPLKRMTLRATLRDPDGFDLMGECFGSLLNHAWKSRAHFAGGLGFPWRFSQEMLSHVRHHEGDPSVASPVVQDNQPRKTKFTFEEAVDVWLRRWSGQYQHEIAAAYVINPRAVNQVLKGVTHVGSKDEAAQRTGRTA